MAFTFVDLFAGIGGFHGALSALGGKCVWASEIDKDAAAIYEKNWHQKPAGDIVPLTEPNVSRSIPHHDVLTAGFPCQPFSKSGNQLGFRDTGRGTLFFNICQILKARKPSVILLENVRNLAGPRQLDTWNIIINELRNLGYQVSDTPLVVSPHLLPKNLGGAAQIRERVFILGHYVGKATATKHLHVPPVITRASIENIYSPVWNTESILDPDSAIHNLEKYRITANEAQWIDAWDDFVTCIRASNLGAQIPGFPLWADCFKSRMPRGYQTLPAWKISFLRKNRDFYLTNRTVIDSWLDRWSGLETFPASRRKLEWQAQNEQSLWDCLLHFRPSGIRVKKPTYLPALVAIAQTPVYAPRRRRITPNEAKRLQGFPEWFSFGNQPDSKSYRQLGNGVSIGVVQYLLTEYVRTYSDEIKRIAPSLAQITRGYSTRQFGADRLRHSPDGRRMGFMTQ